MIMELKIRTIADRKTDDERVIFDVIEDCSLGDYLVLDTTFDKDGYPSNLHRHTYRFSPLDVKKGEVIFLYSKSGKYRKSNIKDTKTPVHLFYWGLDIQVWNNDGDRVILIHCDEAEFKDFE